ncbi:unnamed protein product, partial [Rotaria socialis]
RSVSRRTPSNANLTLRNDGTTRSFSTITETSTKAW